MPKLVTKVSTAMGMGSSGSVTSRSVGGGVLLTALHVLLGQGLELLLSFCELGLMFLHLL